MKLIICNSLPTSRIFGSMVDAWWYAQHGFDVEFWDIAPLFIPDEKLESYYLGAEDYRYKGPNHKIFRSLEELNDALKINSSSLFWHLSRFDRMHDDDLLIKLFNKFQIRYVFQHFDPHDYIGSWQDVLRTPFRELKQYWYRRICEPVGVVTSGCLGRKQVRMRYPNSKIISIPSVKILWQESPPLIMGPYAVYIDESIAHDPDASMHGNVLCNDIASYYQRMRGLFSRVEDALNIPVIIACSGKYTYPDVEAVFGQRTVLYKQTLQLIQGCRLAIGHVSLALDQAIVSNKPAIIVDDVAFTSLRRKGFRDVIKRFRQTPVLNQEIDTGKLQWAMNRDLEFYSEVQKQYLCEPEIRGDYRKICSVAFQNMQ